MRTKTGLQRWSRPDLLMGLMYGLTVAAGAGCSRPGGPYESAQSEFPAPDGGAPSTIGVQTNTTCTPAQTSPENVLPARTTIVGATQGGDQSNVYRTSDLFNLFKSECGGCHVDEISGGFQVSATTFPAVVSGAMGTTVYGLITSDDIATNMPPYGVEYDSRAP